MISQDWVGHSHMAGWGFSQQRWECTWFSMEGSQLDYREPDSGLKRGTRVIMR
jgi:hypothetical protein